MLDYNYLKKHCKKIVIDLSKQQALDSEPKVTQQINFTVNLTDNNDRLMLFTIEEEKKKKKKILDYSQGTVKVLRISSYD